MVLIKNLDCRSKRQIKGQKCGMDSTEVNYWAEEWAKKDLGRQKEYNYQRGRKREKIYEEVVSGMIECALWIETVRS